METSIRWRRATGNPRRVRARPTLLVALCVLLIAACSREEPEAALRLRVGTLVDAIAQHEPAAVQQHLAGDFVGNNGLDRDGARRLAMGFALRHREIGITLGPLDVEMAQQHATVRGTAVLRGGSGRALPDSAQVYEFESGWRLEGGEWMLVSARWKPVL